MPYIRYTPNSNPVGLKHQVPDSNLPVLTNIDPIIVSRKPAFRNTLFKRLPNGCSAGNRILIYRDAGTARLGSEGFVALAGCTAFHSAYVGIFGPFVGLDGVYHRAGIRMQSGGQPQKSCK